jgi:tetratricopeptide (TPR) repeat protein
MHESGVGREQLRELRDGLRQLQHVPERKLHVMASTIPLLRRKDRVASRRASAFDRVVGVETRRQPTSIDDEPVDDALSRRRELITGARHRRLALRKYVIGAVSASLGLCVAAGAKVASVELRRDLLPEHDALPIPSAIAHALSAGPPSPITAPAMASVSSHTEPAAAVSAPEVAATDTPPAEASAPRVATKEAVRLRELSRSALERGSLKSSIEAGERSVDADPTDAEAWLVLGAAYQETGSLDQARRCFRSCVEKGKGTSRGECAAMLR